ncbi:MAG TPA: hypothetical protein VN922_14815, partial [Bacteroidia bacterium]|nr:hypothetical protein [Bacteroidia bacterium]
MKPQKGLLIITFFFVLFAFLAQAQDHAKASHENDTIINTEAYKWIKNSDGLKFTENKGQMADMQGKAVKDLLFKASASGVDMYITTSGLS